MFLGINNELENLLLIANQWSGRLNVKESVQRVSRLNFFHFNIINRKCFVIIYICLYSSQCHFFHLRNWTVKVFFRIKYISWKKIYMKILKEKLIRNFFKKFYKKKPFPSIASNSSNGCIEICLIFIVENMWMDVDGLFAISIWIKCSVNYRGLKWSHDEVGCSRQICSGMFGTNSKCVERI